MRVDCIVTDGGWLDHTVYNLGVLAERDRSGEASAVTVVLERWLSDTAVDRHTWIFSRRDALAMLEDIARAELTGDDKGGADYAVYPMLDDTRVVLTDLDSHGHPRFLIPATGIKRMVADVLGVDPDPEWIEEEEDIPWDDDEEGAE